MTLEMTLFFEDHQNAFQIGGLNTTKNSVKNFVPPPVVLASNQFSEHDSGMNRTYLSAVETGGAKRVDRQHRPNREGAPR